MAFQMKILERPEKYEQSDMLKYTAISLFLCIRHQAAKLYLSNVAQTQTFLFPYRFCCNTFSLCTYNQHKSNPFQNTYM